VKYLLLILLISTTNLYAQESDNATEDANKSPWKGDVQFGYVTSSGNTETTNLNGKFNLGYTNEDWSHLLTAIAFSSSDKAGTTAERYKLEYQADRKYSETSYFFINSTYEEDRFSGFDYRTTLTGGYGRQLYNENKMTLDGEIGVGYRQSELLPDPVTGISLDQSEAMVRLAAKYLWQIEENRSLVSDLTIEVGEDTTISNFELGFVTMIAGDLSLKASFVARHTSEVPVGKEKLDTVTSLNLLYAF